MTSISFYVGRGENIRSRMLLACKLTQKALSHDMYVYIHTGSPASSMQMDDLLWTFSDLGFIPHGMAPVEDDVKVQIGHGYEPAQHCDYLINLTEETPGFFGRFSKIAEILDQSPEVLQKGRERYRFYHDRGYELNYYKL